MAYNARKSAADSGECHMPRHHHAIAILTCLLSTLAVTESPLSVPPHIQNLGGCFRVSYRFVEDGTHDYEINKALEWITVKALSGAYVVTHYGLEGGNVNEHFAEHWTPLTHGRWRQTVG